MTLEAYGQRLDMHAARREAIVDRQDWQLHRGVQVLVALVLPLLLATCATPAASREPASVPVQTSAPSGSWPSTGPDVTSEPSPTAEPTAEPTPDPTAEPTPPPSEGPTKAQLTFQLELVGAVEFADRYSASLSIDGTGYAHGFCGFDAANVCKATTYDWTFPQVTVGATLNWHYRREGGADIQFAQGVDVDFTSGTTIKARCIYNPNVSDEPRCERIQ
jgi:hypothetical protein